MEFMARRLVYVLKGRHVPEELRGQRVLPISNVDGRTNVRVLTGPVTPKVQEVPMDSVTKKSPPRPTRHDVLVRVIECAHGKRKCRLCGKDRESGKFSHEDFCPIPVAVKLVAQQAKRLGRAVHVVDGADESDDVVEVDARPSRDRRTRSQFRRHSSRYPGPG